MQRLNWKILKARWFYGSLFIFLAQTAQGVDTVLIHTEPDYTLRLPAHTQEPGGLTVTENNTPSLDNAASVEPGDHVANKEGAETFQETMLLVDINHQQLNETAFFLRSGAKLFALREDMQKWRFDLSGTQSTPYQGRQYILLSSLPGITYTFDEQTQAVTIDAKPGQLTPSVYQMESRRSIQPARGTGGFLNYDLAVLKSLVSTTKSGVVGLGFFNQLGVGTSDLLLQDQGAKLQATRLMTTWTLDQPEQFSSMRIGDAYTQPGYWGRSVNFGGIQYASNFTTQPGFVRFPYLTASGEAVVPSTVDVFINNTRVLQKNVPPGPFAITDLPAMTGHGEMRVVVKDILGREQIITQPFYSSDALLRVGLADFSYELGVARNNYGISSNQYAHMLATSTYRKGLTDSFTGEVHAELSRNHEAAGVGGTYLMEPLGIFVGSVALSQSKNGAGSLLMAGFDRRAEFFSVGVHSQFATRNFARLGLDPGQSAPKSSSSINMSYASQSWGAIGLAYVLQDDRELGKTRVLTANYGIPLGKNATLHAIAMKNLVAGGNSIFNVVVNFPLGERTSASVSQKMARAGGASGNESFFQIQQNPPVGSGWGYHLEASNNNAQRGSLSLQTEVGSYSVDASKYVGSTLTRVNAAGGVGFLAGRIFAMRPITGSYGVVRVGNYKNVRVYADNNLVGKTDDEGYALLPYLRPYGLNEISVEQMDLPLDAEIGALKITAVPYFRSGVLVEFPIRASRGATLIVVAEDGKLIPTGAIARIIGQKDEFPVAFNGEVYLTGLAAENELEISWHEQNCRINALMPVSADPLPSLGTFICKGITP